MDETRLATEVENDETADGTVRLSASSLAKGEAEAEQERHDLQSGSRLRPGAIIDGRYEVISLLGQGGMSVVYLVRHLTLGKMVALKLMHSHVTDESSIKRFRQEAEATSRLNHHPHIISVSDFGSSKDGNPYMVMEYLDGRSLSQVIKAEGKLDPHRAAKIFKQCAEALEFAHQQGFVHRDLKPSNIMLVEREGMTDFVKIVDFGIVKLLPESGLHNPQLTQTGDVFGSPAYMSPEQCIGKPVDGRSDIYSLGCLMYETLTGRVPFSGENILEVLQKHIDETPPGLTDDVEQHLRVQLELIVFGAMAKDPERRYQSMGRLGQDLTVFLRNDGKRGLVGQVLGMWHLWQLKRGPRSRYVPLRVVAMSFALSVVCALIGVMSWPYISFSEPRSYFEEALWRPADLEKEKPRATVNSARLNDGLIKLAERLPTQIGLHFQTRDPADQLRDLKKLTELYSQMGELEKEQKTWEKVLELEELSKPEDMVSEVDVDHPLRLAETYYLQSEFERAVPIYKRAAEVILKTDPTGRTTRAQAPLARLVDIYARQRAFNTIPQINKLLDVYDSYMIIVHGMHMSGDAKGKYRLACCRHADLLCRLAELESDGAKKIKLLEKAVDEFQRADDVVNKDSKFGEDSALPLLGKALAESRLGKLGVPRLRSASLASYKEAMEHLKEATLVEYEIALANYSDFLWVNGDYWKALWFRGKALGLRSLPSADVK